MNVLRSLVFILLLFSMGCKTSQTPSTNAGAATYGSSKLVWSDEFTSPGLPDSTKWSYNVGGHGWGNNELQYYSKNELRNARVENGLLIIEAHKEPFLGKNYTSARLVTKGKGDWQYAKIEVRARFSGGVGSWPAIWMLASTTPLKWPDDGEIDIMEHVGYNPGKVHASVHTKKYYHSIGTQKTAITTVNDFDREFHVYSVDWNKDSITVSVDYKPYFTFRNEKSGYEAWPFSQKCHLLLNVAVGGNWGGQKGVDDSIFPIRMEIDWVRVYQ